MLKVLLKAIMEIYGKMKTDILVNRGRMAGNAHLAVC